MAASTCETIKNYNIEHFALLLWFHNWRRFFKYNDKTHFKIGIQPRHRRLHWRFAAIRRSLHSQKKCAAPTADGGTSGTCKTKRTGVFGRINTDIAISSGHLHSHECRRFIFGRKRYRNLHESPKRTTTPASRDESEIEPEIKGFRLSVGHRHTAIRSTAPRDLHAAGPPRNPPYGEIPAPAAIPARPAPEQYPATSCAEKLRPDETKIPKTTTNRMKIYSFRILQIEIFYLFLSKCFP